MTKLELYLSLPWTIVRKEHSDDGRYISLRIDELPGFIAAAPTEEELEKEFWDALEAFLTSYIVDGERPPLPAGIVLLEAGAPTPEPEQVSRIDLGERAGRSGSKVYKPGLWGLGQQPSLQLDLAH